jgi:hypothetical protein
MSLRSRYSSHHSTTNLQQKGAVQGQSEKNVFFALALHGPFLHATFFLNFAETAMKQRAIRTHEG